MSRLRSLGLAFVAFAIIGGCGGRELSLGKPGDDPTGEQVPGGGPIPSGAAVAPTCTPLSTTPATLATFTDQSPSPASFASFGTTLFVGVSFHPNGDQTPKGALLEVPVGSAAKLAADTFISGRVHADARRLIFTKGVPIPTGPQSWGFDYPNVLVHDRSSGQVRTLRNSEGTYVAAGDVAVTKKGDLYWITRGATLGSWLHHWDGSAADPTVVASGENLQNLQADDDSIYYRAITPSNVTYFSARPGVNPRELWQSSQAPVGAVSAVDDKLVYLLVPLGHGAATLSVMPKTGGEPTVVPTPEWPLTIGQDLIVDETHLYWASSDAVLRMPKGGGAHEVFWEEPNRWVQGIRVDACNVYWTVVNPGAVMARKK